MEALVGRKVLIQGKHIHAGKKGRVDRVETAQLLKRDGWIVEFEYPDSGSCFVFDRHELQLLN
jgi:hypothetical protein